MRWVIIWVLCWTIWILKWIKILAWGLSEIKPFRDFSVSSIMPSCYIKKPQATTSKHESYKTRAVNSKHQPWQELSTRDDVGWVGKASSLIVRLGIVGHVKNIKGKTGLPFLLYRRMSAGTCLVSPCAALPLTFLWSILTTIAASWFCHVYISTPYPIYFFKNSAQELKFPTRSGWG